MKPNAPMKAAEALQQHQNLIYRAALEKLQAGQPLSEDELTEVKRREAEESKKLAIGKKEKRPGPRSKLTPELIEKIRTHIANGNTFANACLMVRINEATFYKWLRADETEPLIIQLKQAVKEATADAEAKMVERIREASRTNWQAAAWYLERRNPENWGRRDILKAEHTGPNGTALPSPAQIVVYIPDNGRAVQSDEQPKLNAA